MCCHPKCLDLDHRNVFLCRSFRVTFALNAMCSAKYFVEKLKVEKRIIWGLGQDKKLLQYRLPDSISQWTGPDAVPMNPHYGFISHHRPGVALCTCFPPIPMAADYEQKKVCCRPQFVLINTSRLAHNFLFTVEIFDCTICIAALCYSHRWLNLVLKVALRRWLLRQNKSP